VNENKSIAVIIPYFGNLPWYFNYFVHTCKFNPGFDFFFISDLDVSNYQIPDNFHVIPKTLAAIKQLISQKLNIKVNFNDPYKLCDFKPAYGYIFQELVSGFQFWGHGDIDIIFGNLKEFLTCEILNKYDTISLRHDVVTGYFQLFRNINKINELFTHSRDFEKVFTSSSNYCFDETNFTFKEFAAAKHYSKISSQVESMTHVIKRLDEKQYIKAYFDFNAIEGIPGKLKWDNGKLIYKNKIEAALYHMVKFKHACRFGRTVKNIPNIFRISQNGIY